MADYFVALGRVAGDSFEADGSTFQFSAGSDESAVQIMWNWVEGVDALLTNATHVRLREVLGFLKRRDVDVWLIEGRKKVSD